MGTGAVDYSYVPAELLAYLAGFFDGEGSISTYIRKHKHTKRDGNTVVYQSRRLHILVGNNDPSIPVLFKETFGVGILQRIKVVGGLNTMGIHNWRAADVSAVNVLIALLPYLRIKRRRAELSIEFGALMRNRGGPPLSMAVVKKRESLGLAIREENARLNLRVANRLARDGYPYIQLPVFVRGHRV